jgi:hypothetical protein
MHHFGRSVKRYLHHFPVCKTEKLHHFPKCDIREALFLNRQSQNKRPSRGGVTPPRARKYIAPPAISLVNSSPPC